MCLWKMSKRCTPYDPKYNKWRIDDSQSYDLLGIDEESAILPPETYLDDLPDSETNQTSKTNHSLNINDLYNTAIPTRNQTHDILNLKHDQVDNTWGNYSMTDTWDPIQEYNIQNQQYTDEILDLQYAYHLQHSQDDHSDLHYTNYYPNNNWNQMDQKLYLGYDGWNQMDRKLYYGHDSWAQQRDDAQWNQVDQKWQPGQTAQNDPFYRDIRVTNLLIQRLELLFDWYQDGMPFGRSQFNYALQDNNMELKKQADIAFLKSIQCGKLVRNGIWSSISMCEMFESGLNDFYLSSKENFKNHVLSAAEILKQRVLNGLCEPISEREAQNILMDLNALINKFSQ